MKKDIKNEIDEALDFDGLYEAEKFTGNSYKTDEATSALGFLATISNNERKRKLLSSLDDTIFMESEEEYLRKVTDFGFETIYKETFKSESFYDEENDIEERFYIMFHRKYSILLAWDTFRGHRNGGSFYYNWSQKEADVYRPHHSSGHIIGNWSKSPLSVYFNEDFSEHVNPDIDNIIGKEPKWDLENNQPHEEYRKLYKPWEEKFNKYVKDNKLRHVWSGYNDCREAIKHNINSMAEEGDFLLKWKEQPFLWLLHHGEKGDHENYKAINEKKIALLPLDIQEIIKGEEKYER